MLVWDWRRLAVVLAEACSACDDEVERLMPENRKYEATLYFFLATNMTSL